MKQKDLIKEVVKREWDKYNTDFYIEDIDGARDCIFEAVCVDLDMSDITFDVVGSEDMTIYAIIEVKGYPVIIDLDVMTGRDTREGLADTVRGLMQKKEECEKAFGV